MRITLQQLRFFVVIGAEGSVTKAAARLRIAQPALTRHLKQLEQVVGVQLTMRDGRGIALTDAGRHLYHRAKTILDDVSLLKSEMASFENKELINVRVGLPSALSSMISDRIFDCIREIYPISSVQMIDGWSRFIVDWLSSDQLDLGIIYDHTCDDDLIDMIPLAQEAHFLVCRSDDKLAACSEVTLAAVSRLPLILPSQRHGLRRAIDTHFAAIGYKCDPIMEVDAPPTIKKLIERGGAYAILSQSEVVYSASHGLTSIPISDPPIFRLLAVAWRRDNVNLKSIQKIADAIQAEVRTIVENGEWGHLV